jgi:uncharacterized protein DUF4232
MPSPLTPTPGTRADARTPAPGTRALSALAAAILVVGTSALLAGCAGNAPTPVTPSTSPAPTTSAAPTASLAPTSPPAPATVTVTATPAPSAPRAGGACVTSQLSVATVDRGGSGMMKSDNSLRFTNIGSTACTLHGFPTVTAVGANGVTLSQPAQHDGTPGPAVTLAPKASAVAPMLITNADAYDRSACRPTPAKGLRIYPPAQSTALFLPEDLTVCAQPGPNLLRLQPITP